MKAVILAGGRGTRISEETSIKPKPMVTIGGQPILWHIMKIYWTYGIREFVICCGYKGQMIKDYFLDYAAYHSDITKNLETGEVSLNGRMTEPWEVTLVNTGLHTKTAGRLLNIRKYVGAEDFMMTYGDGLANIDIGQLLAFHKSHKKTATVTAVKPLARFGTMEIDEEQTVQTFCEKSVERQGWVNAGFAVFSNGIFDFLGDGTQMLEEEPYERLAETKEMKAYCHPGWWSPMDTVHDRNYLETLWRENKAYWKIWQDYAD